MKELCLGKKSRTPSPVRLEEIRDPRVRQLGLHLIASGWIEDGINVLATNAIPGDEIVILTAARSLTDARDIHLVGMDMFRITDDLNVKDLLVWAYDETPCSFCRESAVRRLIEINDATESLLGECLLDCDPETRRLAYEGLKPANCGPIAGS